MSKSDRLMRRRWGRLRKSSRRARRRAARRWRSSPVRTRVSRSLDRWRLQRAGANAALEQFLARRADTAFPPDYIDLWFLYAQVRKLQPEVVLEFGSGCSTVVLAAALERNGHGHLWTVETEEMWAHETERGLPDQLHPLVTVVHSAGEEGGVARGSSHLVLPNLEPDFLYLDGPTLGSLNPVELEPRFKPGFVMVIDGRRRKARYLRQHLRRTYEFVQLPNYRFLFRLLD